MTKVTVQPRKDDSALGYLKVRRRPSANKIYYPNEPTTVEHTDYVNRCLRSGDLVKVEAKPAPKKKGV